MSKFLENTIIPNTDLNIISNYPSYNFKNFQTPEWVNTLKQINNETKIYFLNNSHFKTGTYRIKYPGKYILIEDIVFDPNPENNFQPYPNQVNYYNHFTYALGFFAAITVECNDVTIDLNNFSIKQSHEHYTNQRFYANIELGSSPFTPNNGPANFGDVFYNCINVVIENGSLNLSSHHGIHGNNSYNLVFKNLRITDYEVGGISLNGCNNIVCDNIRLETIKHVEFNHKFVHLLICKPIIEKLQSEEPEATLHNKKIEDMINDMNSALNNISDNNLQNKNVNNLVDGNAYGLSFNGEGPVIGEFKEIPENYTAYNIFLNNITIESIKTAVEELPAYKREYEQEKAKNDGYDKNIQKGPISQVLDMKQIVDNDTKKYNGNILSDIQLILAKYSKISSIDDSIIEWADDTDKTIEIDETRYIYGLDNMNHVMKGNIGVFFSNVKDSIIQNVHIKNMTNESSLLNKENNGHNNNAIAVIGSDNIEIRNIYSGDQISSNGTNKLLLIK